MNSRKNWIVYLPGQELSFLDVEATVVDGMLYLKRDDVVAVFCLHNIKGFAEHMATLGEFGFVGGCDNNDYCSDMIDALERNRSRFYRQWGIYKTKGE